MSVTSGNSYNAAAPTGAKAETKNNGELEISDFFKLMAAQLQNQNMFDPVDNTQFIAQMAQFSTLTQMQEMQKLSQLSYAVSLIGKQVEVFGIKEEDGSTLSASGVVEDMSFAGGASYIGIGGKKYPVKDVVSVREAG